MVNPQIDKGRSCMAEGNPVVYASMSFEVHSVWDPMGERDAPSEWETPIEIVGEATEPGQNDGPVARIHALLFTDWPSGLDPDAEQGPYIPSWVESLLEPEEGGLSIDELLDWYWRMGFRGTADEIIRESSQ